MSLYSMTGFGEGQERGDSVLVEVEARSVNNRFLDINIKTPSYYTSLDSGLAKQVRKKLGRGRVDISIKRSVLDATANGSGPETSSVPIAPTLNFQALKQYYAVYQTAAAHIGAKLESESTLIELLKKRSVLDEKEESIDLEKEKPIVEKAVANSLQALLKAREFEGAELEQDLNKYLKSLGGQVQSVSSFVADNPKIVKARFDERLEKLQVEVDPDRIEQEIAILLERTDVSEELVRIASHLKQFKQTMLQSEPVGRKLEFMLQELGREVNTIGSKCQTYDISSTVIEMKSVLEKLREQVLNIE